jgi:hypothetical protein
MDKFCGRVEQNGNEIGNLYRADTGYVIREVKPFARKVGPVLFGGRVFRAKDFKLKSSVDLGYGVDRTYTLEAL